MSEFKELTDEIIHFRDERDWKQFHNSKDLAIALSVEASELLERFLWKDAEEVDKKGIEEELADVLTYALLLAHEEDLDIKKIIREKLSENNKKYPVGKSKGTAKKYDEL